MRQQSLCKTGYIIKNYDTAQSIFCFIVLNHTHAQARTCVPHTHTCTRVLISPFSIIPRTILQRSFNFYAVPSVWNSLPCKVRSPCKHTLVFQVISQILTVCSYVLNCFHYILILRSLLCNGLCAPS